MDMQQDLASSFHSLSQQTNKAMTGQWPAARLEEKRATSTKAVSQLERRPPGDRFPTVPEAFSYRGPICATTIPMLGGAAPISFHMWGKEMFNTACELT